MAEIMVHKEMPLWHSKHAYNILTKLTFITHIKVGPTAPVHPRRTANKAKALPQHTAVVGHQTPHFHGGDLEAEGGGVVGEVVTGDVAGLADLLAV